MDILKLALEAWHKTTKATKFQVKAETSFSIHWVLRGCRRACGNSQRLKPRLYPHTIEQVKDGISAQALMLMQRALCGLISSYMAQLKTKISPSQSRSHFKLCLQESCPSNSDRFFSPIGSQWVRIFVNCVLRVCTAGNCWGVRLQIPEYLKSSLKDTIVSYSIPVLTWNSLCGSELKRKTLLFAMYMHFYEQNELWQCF